MAVENYLYTSNNENNNTAGSTTSKTIQNHLDTSMLHVSTVINYQIEQNCLGPLYDDCVPKDLKNNRSQEISSRTRPRTHHHSESNPTAT